MNIIMKKLIPRALPLFLPGIIVSILIGNKILPDVFIPLQAILILSAGFIGHLMWKRLAKDYIDGKLK